MSAGAFEIAVYSATYEVGETHPILVQPETRAASIGSVTNAGVDAAPSNPISARVTGSRRGIGLFARTVTLRLPATDQPAGYLPLSRIRIPALTETFWNAAIRGATCTYLGVNCDVVGRAREEAR